MAIIVQHKAFVVEEDETIFKIIEAQKHHKLEMEAKKMGIRRNPRMNLKRGDGY